MLTRMPRIGLVVLAVATLLLWAASKWSAAQLVPPPNGDDGGGPWGKPVDGLVCRLTVQPRYVIGQAISATVEVKNVSDKERYIMPNLDPMAIEHVMITVVGPKGNVRQSTWGKGSGSSLTSFKSIAPGEVRRFEVVDLAKHFMPLDPLRGNPFTKPNEMVMGKYELRMRFSSPKIPTSFQISSTITKDTPLEMLAGQWANEVESAAVAFELLPLGKDDLVIHEWGVFTVLNDSNYANANRKEEWGSLPKFFYRQFPNERLRWAPAFWDKPIIYAYATPTPFHFHAKVIFAAGAPVVWWPAVADPLERRPHPEEEPELGQTLNGGRPFRSLTWNVWAGDRVPVDNDRMVGRYGYEPWAVTADFPLPDDCWLKQARLPSASRLTVIGNDPDKRRTLPGSQDRLETERFLYYDGLVPAPDYLHCEKTDATSVTLRNGAKFDLLRLFVVDRRVKGQTAFAYMDGTTQTFKAGATLSLKPEPIAAKDWPGAGVKQLRKALLDAGLFEPEADSLIKIWQKQLLESDGLVAFHILPVSEYDRMLPLDILPAPAAKPVRVGIAHHPNLEIEPALRERVGPLIRQLDDAKYEVRTAASKALLEIGPVAIGLLRAELSKDLTLEMRRRIESVLESVDATEWLKVPPKDNGGKK